MAIIGSRSITGITTAFDSGDVPTKEIVDGNLLSNKTPPLPVLGSELDPGGRGFNWYNNPPSNTNGGLVETNGTNLLFESGAASVSSYTTPGTYTYNIPGNTRILSFDIQGGGGGGSAASTNSTGYIAGSIWTTQYLLGNPAIRGVAVGPTAAVRVAGNNYVQSNLNPQPSTSAGWVVRTTGHTANALLDAKYYGGLFHVTGAYGTPSRLYTQSTDSIHWTMRTVAYSASDYYVFSQAGSFYFIGGVSGGANVSTDTIVWTTRTVGQITGSSSGGYSASFVFYKSKYYHSDTNGAVRVSTDTIVWDRVPGPVGTTDAFGRMYLGYTETNPLMLTTDGSRLYFKWGQIYWYNGDTSAPNGYARYVDDNLDSTLSFKAVFPLINRSGTYTFYPINIRYFSNPGFLFATGYVYVANGIAVFLQSTDGLIWSDVTYQKDYVPASNTNFNDRQLYWCFDSYENRGILCGSTVAFTNGGAWHTWSAGSDYLSGFSGAGGAGGSYMRFDVPRSLISGDSITINVGSGGTGGTSSFANGQAGTASTVSWNDIHGMSCSMSVNGGSGGGGSYPSILANSSGGSTIPSSWQYEMQTFGGAGAAGLISAASGNKASNISAVTTVAIHPAMGGGGGAYSNSSNGFLTGGLSGDVWLYGTQTSQSSIPGQTIQSLGSRTPDSLGSWGGMGGSVLFPWGGHWRRRYVINTTKQKLFNVLNSDSQSVSGATYSANRLTILNNKYILPFQNGVAYSTDGLSWKESVIERARDTAARGLSNVPSLFNIGYLNGYYVAALSPGNNARGADSVYRSTDLINWSSYALSGWTAVSGTTYSRKILVSSTDKIVLIGDPNGDSWVTTDAIIWSKQSNANTTNLSGVANSLIWDSSTNLFACVHQNNHLRISTDGFVWSARTAAAPPVNATYRNLGVGGGLWFLGARLTNSFPVMCTSTDTITWTMRTLGWNSDTTGHGEVTTFYYNSDPGEYLVSGVGNSPAGSQIPFSTSTDGIRWTLRTTRGVENAAGRSWNSISENAISSIIVSPPDSLGIRHYVMSVFLGSRSSFSFTNGDLSANVIVSHPVVSSSGLLYPASNGFKGSGGGGGAFNETGIQKGPGGNGGNGYVNITPLS